MTCSRLRLATVTLDGIYDLHPYSWDGLFGFPGRRGQNVGVVGQPGRYRTFPKLSEQRAGRLGLLIRPQSSTGTVTLPGGRCQHLEANQDLILGLIGSETLQTLEWDMCDGTSRFLDVEFVDSSTISHRPGGARELPLSFVAAYPAWRKSGTPVTVNVTTGAGVSVNPGGNAPVDNAVLTFTAAGTLTNTLTGEQVTVDPAAGGPVTVDTWTGQVTQGGVPARNRVTGISHARILHLEPNVANPLTATGATIAVSYTPHWW